MYYYVDFQRWRPQFRHKFFIVNKYWPEKAIQNRLETFNLCLFSVGLSPFLSHQLLHWTYIYHNNCVREFCVRHYWVDWACVYRFNFHSLWMNWRCEKGKRNFQCLCFEVNVMYLHLAHSERYKVHGKQRDLCIWTHQGRNSKLKSTQYIVDASKPLSLHNPNSTLCNTQRSFQQILKLNCMKHELMMGVMLSNSWLTRVRCACSFMKQN